MRQPQHFFVLFQVLMLHLQLGLLPISAKVTAGCSKTSCVNNQLAANLKNSLTKADLLSIVNQSLSPKAETKVYAEVKTAVKQSKSARKTIRKRKQNNQALNVHRFTLKDAIKTPPAPNKFARRSFAYSPLVKPSSLIKSIATPVYAHLSNKAIQNAQAITNLMPPIELQLDQPSQEMTSLVRPQTRTVLLSPGVVARNIATSKVSLAYVRRPRPVQLYAPRWTPRVYNPPVRALSAVTVVRAVNPDDYIDNEFPTEPPVPKPQPPQQQEEMIEQQREDYWSGKKSVRSRGQAKKSFQQITSIYSAPQPRKTRTVVTETKFVPSHTSIVSTTMYSPEKKTTIIDTHHPHVPN